MEPISIILIISLAVFCEFLDASLGMLFGTILSPVLIMLGFNPLVVVPSILISQAVGGLIASFLHHRFENVKFGLKVRSPGAIADKIKEVGFSETIRKGVTKDLRATLIIAALGILATVGSVLIAVNIPKKALEYYIGILVLAMGIILLSKLKFTYTWKKILGIGLLSSFNKGLSGGGFGPVTTAGQVIAGRDGRASVGSTTLAEAPICITGFLTYWLAKGISDWTLPLYLTAGSMIGALIGPHFTAKFKNDKKLRKILGSLVLILGLFTLLKVLGVIKLSVKI
ncbi:MAG: sulfite exporter TauE/SafE family protein [bacterium]|nr:sulfite exporter TauE/SafE family protein [bacterium]